MNSSSTKIKDEVFNVPQSEYRVKRTIINGENDRHYVCELYFRSIKVEGKEISIHIVNDTIRGTGLLYFPDINITSEPVISPSQAIVAATEALGSSAYYWQNELIENSLKTSTGNYDTSFYPKPKLCFYDGKLSFKFKIFSAVPDIRYEFYVDAVTGNILAKISSLQSGCVENPMKLQKSKGYIAIDSKPSKINIKNDCLTCAFSGCHSGSADLLYYGTKSIDFEQLDYGGNCLQRTKDLCNPAQIHVRKAYELGIPYPAQNFWTALECTNLTTNLNWGTVEQRATTAIWCFERVSDYFSSVHSRAGYDSNNGTLRIMVYDTLSSCNAFWKGYGEIDIGTGNIIAGCGGDFTALDVSGHEFTHGVIETTAAFPNAGESGALNEGLADIFGNHCDFFTKQNFNTGKVQNYVMHDDHCGITSPVCRFLGTPEVVNMPRVYKGNNWGNTADTFDNGWRHNNSSIISLWYFLLSEGSNGPQLNENGHTFCVKPIGRDKVVKVLYRALNSGYFTSTLTFTDLRSKTIMAARDEFGYWSPEVAEMEAAFFAVGVGYNGTFGVNTDPAFAFSYLPFVSISSKTESAAKSYHFNNSVRHHDYTVSGSANIEVTSNMEISFQPFSWDPNKAVTIASGSEYWGHIDEACSANGLSGARHSSYSNGNSQVNSNSESDFYKAKLDNLETNFSIIPNPFADSFEICFYEKGSHIEKIEVVNILGSIVYTKLDPDQNQSTVNLQALPAGLYIVKFRQSGRVFSKRIVKQ